MPPTPLQTGPGINDRLSQILMALFFGINLGIKKGNRQKTQKYNYIGWSLPTIKGEKL